MLAEDFCNKTISLQRGRIIKKIELRKIFWKTSYFEWAHQSDHIVNIGDMLRQSEMSIRNKYMNDIDPM